MAGLQIGSAVARPRIWFGYLVVALAMLAGWIAPQGLARRAPRAPAIGTAIEQCANRLGGTASSINNCAGIGWTTGNLNVNNSVYRQGDFVPFRTKIDKLVSGRSYKLTIGYDAVESGLHAYDYLGSYDASAFPGQQIVPCYDVSNTGGSHACGTGPPPNPDPPSTLAVPTDTQSTFPNGSHPPPQPAGDFSAWGARLEEAEYVSPSPIGPGTTGTVKRFIQVTFAADGTNAVLAWGGHIASVLDWGPGRTYTSVHAGAPFHMRLPTQICEVGGDCTTTGNQDLSMHTTALVVSPGLTTQASPQSATTDQTVIDTATLTGVAGKVVTGTVQFFVCGPAGAPPDCTAGGTPVGGPQVVNTVGGGPNGQATIAFPQAGQGPVEPGRYCFRAEYTPSNAADYSPALHTDTTNECFVLTLPPPVLTVTKLCVPETDPGLFNLLLDGSPIPNGTNVPCGQSSGPFETAAGTHTVSESAGTGTSLANYTSAFGGDCAPAGLLTLALGDSAVCAITNTRLPPAPPASLTVHKVCDPTEDPGSFEILVDDQPIALLSCGESAVPVELAPGTYTVREAAGEDTTLADYATTISGDCAADGSITLGSGEPASCTFTNTRIPPTSTLRVDKACAPAGDDGRFTLLIATFAGTPVHRVTVGCGGSTGAVQVSPGVYVVRERGAEGTNLADYDRYVGGDCGPVGIVVVASGDQLTCLITNVRKSTQPQPALLTVTKICVPADDGGLFDVTVGGQTEQDVACGQSIGPVALAPGSHQVSEAGGTATSLSDYTSAIGGACAVDGSVTLAAGETATCTITNVRSSTDPPPEQTGTVQIQKQCSPAGANGNFQAELDEHVFRIACGESVGPVEVGVGDHRVGEVMAVDGTPQNFTTTIGGDCSPSGSFTLNADEHVVCVITNTFAPIEPPVNPPSACNKLSVRPRTVRVGRRVRVVALVRAGRRPVAGIPVYARGPGVSTVRTTGANGRALFVLTLHRRGVLRITIRKPFDCPKPPPGHVGIIGGATPPVTG